MTEELPGAAPSEAMREYAILYPEVARAGSLQDALQTEVDRASYGFTVELTASPGWRHVAAKVAVGDRSANVVMARQVRSFSVDCWTGGVHMATGSTDDLSEVAGVFHSWPRAPRVGVLVTRWPFLRTWELAEAYERGDAVPVRWRRLRETTARTGDSALHMLVEVAFEEPRLRVLSPGRSMRWLTFSRRAAPPICRDLPGAMPIGGDRYRVRFADGRVREANGAVEAVSLVVDGLPDDAVPWPPGV
ncbi:DUF6193 family natural product biosynthesis protein [Streptomyces cucumeris]|uniref:DUF6193 family natural product biosynthesis protein n=1 Tax=Streptomyces cucumeris TaxID=2962890 RepID=UPI003D73E9B6